MKTLELNQMENLNGGTDPVKCGAGVLIGIAIFGIVTGGVGLIAGGAVAVAYCS